MLKYRLFLGILRNVSPLPPPTVVSQMDLDKDNIFPLLQPIISSCSISEISNLAQELITTQANEPQIEKLSLKHAPKSDHRSPVQIELEKVETRLRTLQLTLEILTSTCATLSDPEFAPIGDDEEDGDEELDKGALTYVLSNKRHLYLRPKQNRTMVKWILMRTRSMVWVQINLPYQLS